MPIFGGESQNIELFEELFRTCLKILNQLAEGDRIHFSQYLMRGEALQTFRNISSASIKYLADVLTVFHTKYVKTQSMATARHKFQRLIFNPVNLKLIDFPDQLQQLAKDAIEVAAHAITEQFNSAKMSPHLKNQ